MNYPYPAFFLDVQLAKRRLAQVLAIGRGVSGDDLFSADQKKKRARYKGGNGSGHAAAGSAHSGIA